MPTVGACYIFLNSKLMNKKLHIAMWKAGGYLHGCLLDAGYHCNIAFPDRTQACNTTTHLNI
jgi:hypothetical protein